eukprot:scaffold287186_cov33-Attheya_sp.AAC.1
MVRTLFRCGALILHVLAASSSALLTSPHSVSRAFVVGRSPLRSSSFRSSTARQMSLKPYIETLIAGERHLTSEETQDAFGLMLQGADDVQ